MSVQNTPIVADFPSKVWVGESPSRSDPTVYREPNGSDYAQIVAEVAAVESQLISGNSANTLSLTNDNAGSLVVGTPVYLKSNGHVDKAEANALATSYILGLVTVGGATSTPVSVQLTGQVTLTTAQWDAVAGTSGGLSPGTVYYLSATSAGAMTSSLPATTGNFDATCILALSSTTALIIRSVDPIAHA